MLLDLQPSAKSPSCFLTNAAYSRSRRCVVVIITISLWNCICKTVDVFSSCISSREYTITLCYARNCNNLINIVIKQSPCKNIFIYYGVDNWLWGSPEFNSFVLHLQSLSPLTWLISTTIRNYVPLQTPSCIGRIDYIPLGRSSLIMQMLINFLY